MRHFSAILLLALALVLILSITNCQAQENQINPEVLEIINRISAEHQQKLFQQEPSLARNVRMAPKPLDVEIVWN